MDTTVSPQQTSLDDLAPDLFPRLGTPGSSTQGYSVPTVLSVVKGLTYRQVDYWARTGLVEPSIRPAAGSGSQRLYAFGDILVLKIVKRLLDTGIALQRVRGAVEYLRERGVDNLSQVTLCSDGVSVYEVTSAEEMIDVLRGGQGVFAIAVNTVVVELSGDIAEFPALDAAVVTAKPEDELSRRRQTKKTA